MKLLIVGDAHFRQELPYSPAFKDGRRAEWGAVKQTIIEASAGVDAVVMMGDNFNSRHNHSAVQDEFVTFLNDFGDKDIYIIAGNHERYGLLTALDHLKSLGRKNWHIFTDIGSVKIGNSTLVFLPYLTPGVLGVKDLQEANEKIIDMLPDGDFLFAHHTVSGIDLHGGSIEYMNEVVLDLSRLEKKYLSIFTGHIHDAQRVSDKTLVVGSIFTAEVGEDHKSVFTFDTKSGDIDSIDLPVRGIYKHVWNGPSSLMHMPSNSIVKCVVTDRSVNLDEVRDVLTRFDAYVIIEQYPREREKVHFEDGAMDLSVDNMLKIYADARNLSYNRLKDGFELIR